MAHEITTPKENENSKDSALSASNRGKRKGSMTVQEAGRMGGEKVAQQRGSQFFSEIGRKGGEAVSQNRAHMSAIGQRGGQAGGRARAAKKRSLELEKAGGRPTDN